ncbi:MAG TPA: hypothetical protein VNT54_16395 [Solirubrobacteraceae bacterium]|nr:hypothetical protein [Solirubrobacteraceae bacterium]
MIEERRPEPDELIAVLLGPAGPELTCEACFEHLDRYVDAELAGEDPDRAVPDMRAHLVGCPACADDYESLLAFAGSHDDDAQPPA